MAFSAAVAAAQAVKVGKVQGTGTEGRVARFHFEVFKA